MLRRLGAALLICALLLGACRSGGKDKNETATTTSTPAASATATAGVATPTPLPSVEPTPPPTPTPTPTPVADPVRLQIPRIGVDAPIIALGVNSAGEMDSPNDPYSVGWYAPGFKPWEPGNAVMDGHVDWYTGIAGVFWSVRTLTPGDKIVVRAADKQSYEFQVTEVDRYTPDDAPVDRIFGPNPNKGLVLITCTGVFDSRTHDYNQRFVVYAEAVKDEPRGVPEHHEFDN
jgi:sortase (surface protein transpeptidase)